MYQVVDSSPRTAEAGTGQGSIAPWPRPGPSALPARATRNATWRAEFSTGQVTESRRGGGLGEFSTPTAVAPSRADRGARGTGRPRAHPGPYPATAHRR